MPMIREIRRMGAGWSAIVERVESFMESIPADGITRVAFEDACLQRVHPEDRDAVIRALKGKKLIVPVRDGIVWRIFRERPESRRFAPVIDQGVAQFLRVVAPHIHRVGTVEAPDGAADREARARQTAAAQLIGDLVVRHVQRGTDLALMREALWLTFNAEAMTIISNRVWALKRTSQVRELAIVKPKSKRAAANLDLDERVAHIVGNAGSDGISKTTLGRSLSKPRPSFAELDDVIARLTNNGLIQAGTMKLTRKGKAGLRLFSPDARMPRVTSLGVAAFD